MQIAETPSNTKTITGDRLRSFIERIERLHEEKKAMEDDIGEIYAEAKGEGFCKKTIRQLIRIRKMEEHEYLDSKALLEAYADALGQTV